MARRRGSFICEDDSAAAVFVIVMAIDTTAEQMAAVKSADICNFLWSKFIIELPFRRLSRDLAAGGWVGGRFPAPGVGFRFR
jgi:hypothetical protein